MNISDEHSQERFYKTFSMSISIEHYQEGDVIIKQGDYNDKIYFIIDGIVEVLQDLDEYHFFKNINFMKSVNFKKNDNKCIEAEGQTTETNRKETNHAMIEFSPLRKLKRFQSKQFKSKTEEEIENPDIDKDNIINELKAGNYFGEISCLNPKMTATASVE